MIFFSICSVEEKKFSHNENIAGKIKSVAKRKEWLLLCLNNYHVLAVKHRKSKTLAYQITHFKHSCTKCYHVKTNWLVFRLLSSSQFICAVLKLCNFLYLWLTTQNCNNVIDGNGEYLKVSKAMFVSHAHNSKLYVSVSHYMYVCLEQQLIEPAIADQLECC